MQNKFPFFIDSACSQFVRSEAARFPALRPPSPFFARSRIYLLASFYWTRASSPFLRSVYGERPAARGPQRPTRAERAANANNALESSNNYQLVSTYCSAPLLVSGHNAPLSAHASPAFQPKTRPHRCKCLFSLRFSFSIFRFPLFTLNTMWWVRICGPQQRQHRRIASHIDTSAYSARRSAAATGKRRKNAGNNESELQN